MPTQLISVTYDGKPCLNPWTLYQECQKHGLPTSSFWGKANSYCCPLGPAVGRGWLLMSRKQIDEIDKTIAHPLYFRSGDKSVTFPSIYFKRAICITPGADNSVKQAYLVEVVDRRAMAKWSTIDQAYNIMDPTATASSVSCHWPTRNEGVLWTWQTLFTELFEQAKLTKTGSDPDSATIPEAVVSSAVAFRPLNWRFHGVSAYDSLCTVLEAVGFTLRYDPIKDQFGIVEYGSPGAAEGSSIDATDTANEETLTESRNKLIHDLSPIVADKLTIPGKVRVFFHARRFVPGDTGVYSDRDSYELRPAHVVEVTPENAGEESDSLNIGIVWADMPAFFTNDADTASNQTDLVTYANVLAIRYIQRLKAGQGQMHKIYSGVIDVAPSSQLSGVCWKATCAPGRLGGLVTEVLRTPGMMTDAGDIFDPVKMFNNDGASRVSTPAIMRPSFPGVHILRGRATEPIALAGGTVEIMVASTESVPSWVGTGITVDAIVFLRPFEDIQEGDHVLLLADFNVKKYIIIAAECPGVGNLGSGI